MVLWRGTSTFYYHCSMAIIHGGLQEIPLIQTIVAATWPATYGEILSARQIEYMIDLFYSADALRENLQAGHSFLIYLDTEGTALGFAGFELNHHNPTQAKLHKLYVLPGTQGKGIGRQLLDAVRQKVQDAGQTHLFLNVNRYNKARLFYEKYGFTIARSEDIDIGDGYFMNDYIMELAL